MLSRRTCLSLAWLFAFVSPLYCQTAKNDECPLMAVLPAWVASNDSSNGRARFELRECPGRIQVLGYERSATRPSLRFDTMDTQLVYLAHSFNVLALQGLGGASDHVYVFVFQDGKPKLAAQTATKDYIQMRVEKRSVVVEVPPVTYPDERGKWPPTPPPKRYVFPQEF